MNLKSEKILYLVLIVLIIPLVIIGCKNKEEGPRTTIRFVTWKPNIPAAWDEIFAIFEKEHPEIRVEKEVGPHSSTAFHDLLTQKLKNKSKDVDVFLMDVIWPSEFAAAGWAANLDKRFPASEREKFLKATILANTYEGKIYGVPLFIDSGMLYYRKDLLDKYRFQVPRTWDELLIQAELISSEEARLNNTEIYGFTGQFKQYEGLVCDMMEFIMGNGGYILDQETGKSGLAEKPAVDAVRFVRNNIIARVAPTGVLTYQEPESLDVFIQGKAIFHRNWPYAWEVANNPERSKIAGKVGIARLPHFPKSRSYATLGGWQVGISSYSKHKDAAWTFVEFLTSDRIQKLLTLKAGRAPSRTALYSDDEILKSYPHLADMKDVFMTAQPRPVTPLYPAVSNVLQRYFSKAIADLSVDIEREAKEASAEIEKIISMDKVPEKKAKK